jgi:hypothetical protein
MNKFTVKEGLCAALAALGPNGEKWAQGDKNSVLPAGFLCALTACGNVAPSFFSESPNSFYKIRSALEAQLPKHKSDTSIARFNDDPETTFADIKALFERAIKVEN